MSVSKTSNQLPNLLQSTLKAPRPGDITVTLNVLNKLTSSGLEDSMWPGGAFPKKKEFIQRNYPELEKDKFGYSKLGCKSWQQAIGIKKVTPVHPQPYWCCSSCHYMAHHKHQTRWVPDQMTNYVVCCKMGSLCLKQVHKDQNWMNVDLKDMEEAYAATYKSF